MKNIIRKISIRGKLKLMRSDQYVILAKHYPTSINPHKNPKHINSMIKTGQIIYI